VADPEVHLSSFSLSSVALDSRLTRDLVGSAKNCPSQTRNALAESHGSYRSVDESGFHLVPFALWSHGVARHVNMPVKAVPVGKRAEVAVDAIRQLYVFVQEKYEPPLDHEIAQMTLAVPWLTVCLVGIDSVEPSDGNRWTEIEWIASQVWL
jgi:hypothetical protein